MSTSSNLLRLAEECLALSLGKAGLRQALGAGRRGR